MEHVEAATQPLRAATRAVAVSPRDRAPRMLPPRTGRDRGATMVEYGLMVALVALAALLALTAFGIEVNGLFDKADLLDALA